MAGISTRPTYLNGDTTAAGKVLNRFNIQGSKETEVFTAFVRLGKEKIPYKEAMEAAGLIGREDTFIAIIKRFEECQIMVLRHGTQTDRSGAPAGYVRLCNEGSYSFVSEYISEMLYLAYAQGAEMLPFASEMRKLGVDVPQQYVENFDLDMVRSMFTASPEALEDSLTIVAIPVKNDVFYFTAGSISFVCDLCIMRMQAILQSSNLVHMLARILNITLSEAKEKLDTRDPVIWNSVIDVMYNKIDSMTMQQEFKNYPEVPVFVVILYHVLKSKVLEMETQYKFREESEEFAKIVNTKMRDMSEGLNEQQFKDLLGEIAIGLGVTEDQIPEHVRMFFEHSIVMADEVGEHPSVPVVKIDQFYIHREVLRRVISDRYFSISERLKEYYKTLLKRYLTKSISPKDIVFLDEETFETSVHNKVMEIDPLYFRILKHPLILATTIIESGKGRSLTDDTVSPDDSLLGQKSNARRLSLFFDTDTQRLLKWTTIFNISIPKLGEEAYNSLSIFAKIILLFTGRYKSLHSRLRRISTISSIVESQRDLTNKDLVGDKKAKGKGKAAAPKNEPKAAQQNAGEAAPQNNQAKSQAK